MEANMEFKGSKTEQNLMIAFSGESQARNKNTTHGLAKQNVSIVIVSFVNYVLNAVCLMCFFEITLRFQASVCLR